MYIFSKNGLLKFMAAFLATVLFVSLISIHEIGVFADNQTEQYDGGDHAEAYKVRIRDYAGNPVENAKVTLSNDGEDIALFQDGTYSDGNIKVFKFDGKYHLLNSENDDLCQFDDIDVLTDSGYFAVKIDGKWGFVDKSGNVVIKPDYQEARSFSYGLGAVFNGKNWGFVNSDGELAIDYQFADVGYFDDSMNCMVAVYEEETRHLAIDEEIEDDVEIVSVESHPRTVTNDDGTTEIKGSKDVIVRIKYWQLITLYNEI